jgi:LytS/YehU family sensor histidine kinase
MEIILADISVLVTAAFALTLVPRLRDPERSILSTRDKGTVLLVFLVLGLVEEITASQSGWMNARIVAVCAAGLVAGPWVGFIVGIFVSWLAVAYDGLPLGSIAISMLAAGLLGGWLYRWRRDLAQRPISGFCLALGISLLRNGLVFLFAPAPGADPKMLLHMGIAPVLQGLGTALILAIVQQARDRDKQTRAVASGEVPGTTSAHESPFRIQCVKFTGCVVKDFTSRNTAGNRVTTGISPGQFRSTRAVTGKFRGGALGSSGLFRN